MSEVVEGIGGLMADVLEYVLLDAARPGCIDSYNDQVEVLEQV
jgi:hypothetical protein